MDGDRGKLAGAPGAKNGTGIAAAMDQACEFHALPQP